jgi:thiamine-phosphate pyrophosphorylase
MNKLFAAKGLYAITPDLDNGVTLLHKAKMALQGGAAVLQYRDKISSANEKLHRAQALKALCSSHQVPLIINDDPVLALACHADGVHLGQADGSVQHARSLLGETALIGVTCHHDLSLAIQAERQGANYVAFGRFFNSNTKPGAALASVETLFAAKKALTIPVVAIGGINQANASALIDAGADYIAVVEQLFAADDVYRNSQNFSALFLD